MWIGSSLVSLNVLCLLSFAQSTQQLVEDMKILLVVGPIDNSRLLQQIVEDFHLSDFQSAVYSYT